MRQGQEFLPRLCQFLERHAAAVVLHLDVVPADTYSQRHFVGPGVDGCGPQRDESSPNGEWEGRRQGFAPFVMSS